MSDLLASSIDLMIVGMGTVFAFLTLLIFVTNLMSKFVIKFNPEVPVTPSSSATTSVSKPQNSPAEDTQLIAIISEAIKQHRNKS